MGEAASETSSGAGEGRHQRRLRNYLLDSRFQLKYAGYLVAIALILSVGLGFIVWRKSQDVIAQSHEAVNQSDQVVVLGKNVFNESKKVSEVVRMNIVKDPVYKDNPALLEAFKADSKKQDDELLKKQKAFENQAATLKAHAGQIASGQRTFLIWMGLILALLVVAVGLAGIVVTHKVAGPIYKMKRQFADVGSGRLKIPSKLRKGDELVHFFEAFDEMVRSLRSRQHKEIEMLDAAIEKLSGATDDAQLKQLKELRSHMQLELEDD